MSDPVAIAAEEVEPRVGSIYPPPHDAPCNDRQKRALGDVFGLSDFGVNLTTLPPGVWSSQRHWHAKVDEFVFVVEGVVTLVTDEGENDLGPGMCAGFKAGNGDGHHLINKTDKPAVYLEVGTRKPDDSATYPDIDMALPERDGGPPRFFHKDGTPY